MTVLPYEQARQIVAATVPNHVVTVGDDRWYDYGAAVEEICGAFNTPAGGWMAPFIDSMVAGEVEDTYGVLLPDWQRRGQPNSDSAGDYTYPGDLEG